MSAPADRAERPGAALVLAVVVAVVVGLSTLSLWRLTAASRRTSALDIGTTSATSLADSAIVRGFGYLDHDGWRVLTEPGAQLRAAVGSSPRGRWRTDVGRSSWGSLVVRGTSELRTGVPRAWARADHRALIPLVTPIPFPTAALIGARPWQLATGATASLAPTSASEARCRAGATVRIDTVRPLPVLSGLAHLPVVDPDTVRDTLIGAFRLQSGRIRRSLAARGMLVLDTDLFIRADLRLTGVLLTRGSVHSSGGRLDLIGAAVAGDSGGGYSVLGAGDRVRYDACAIRRALELITRLGPSADWNLLTLH